MYGCGKLEGGQAYGAGLLGRLAALLRTGARRRALLRAGARRAGRLPGIGTGKAMPGRSGSRYLRRG